MNRASYTDCSENRGATISRPFPSHAVRNHAAPRRLAAFHHTPIGEPSAERRHDSHRDKQRRGGKHALAGFDVKDLAEIVENPVEEDVLEIIQHEIAESEQNQVLIS